MKIYQLDAFTDELFGGNPAAVCPLDTWLSDALLQNIAMENNLAETAFYVKEENSFHIRWFTPTVEVDLCGHATLAAAYVLFHYENYTHDLISFQSRSGILKVSRDQDFIILNFPTDILQEIAISADLLSCFDLHPLKIYKGLTDYMFVYENEAQIRQIKIDLDRICNLDARGVIITAPGDEVDFVSRFFAPQSGIDEDPVTGSAHTTLTPYWHQALQKNEMTAIQLSDRKGFLKCCYLGDRIEIRGKVRLYLRGEIFI